MIHIIYKEDLKEMLWNQLLSVSAKKTFSAKLIWNNSDVNSWKEQNMPGFHKVNESQVLLS